MKRIKGFEDYSITTDGRVWSHKTNKYLKPCGVSRGKAYQLIGLRSDNKTSRRYIHRLVAAAYLGDNPHLEVNHIDFNPRNNDVSNLEWCTPKQNIAHSMKAGHMKIGTIWESRKRKSKKKIATQLTEYEKSEIRRLYGKQTTLSLAKKFNAGLNTINYMCRDLR